MLNKFGVLMLELPINLVELERIFTQVVNHKVRRLAITSAEPKEGVTTLALALAKRAAAHGKQTLLVDFNLYNPQVAHYFGLEAMAQLSFIHTITKNIHLSDIENLYVLGAPVVGSQSLEFRDQDKLGAAFLLWLKEFDLVIVDCSHVNSSATQIIPAENVSACCDATVLVVLAGQTVEAKVQEAVSKLRNANAKLLGAVFNDQFNPRLEDELCRETHRFDPYAYQWMEKLRKKIRNSPLLTTDV